MKQYIALVAATALLSACGGSSDSNNAPQTGEVAFSMTDAPADDLQQVHLTIPGISLKPADGERIYLELDEPLIVDNLLDLQGTLSTAVLPPTEVPAGRYNWIRLHVLSGDNNTYVVDDMSGQYPLYVPGQQSGNEKVRHVQLVSGFVVPVGGEVSFTLDVDLRRAITKPTNKDYYLLRPAIRMVDNSTVGAITGTISDALIEDASCTSVMEADTLEGNAVYLYNGADATAGDVYLDAQGEPADSNNPVTTANVVYDAETDSYTYEIGFVPAGSYTVAFTCQALDDNPENDDALIFPAQRNVTVTENKTETADLPEEPPVIASE